MVLRRRLRAARRPKRFRIRNSGGRGWNRFKRIAGVRTTQTFSEMTSLGDVTIPIGTVGAGFNWNFKMTDLPQVSQYSALYQQYKLKSVQLILVPRITQADGTLASGGAGGTGGLYNGRICYAIQDTPEYTAPSNEVQVMQMNGAKIAGTHRLLKIRCYPKPVLQMNDGVSGSPTSPLFIGVSDYRNATPFINFDNHGDAVPHTGVEAWITLPGALTGSSSVVVYDFYAKYSFVCRDPR